MSSTLRDTLGGPHLCSPALVLLDIVDCLGCVRGMGGEINEGMRKRLGPGCVGSDSGSAALELTTCGHERQDTLKTILQWDFVSTVVT